MTANGSCIVCFLAVMTVPLCILGQGTDPYLDIRAPNPAIDTGPNTSRIREASVERKRENAQRLEKALLDKDIDKLRPPQSYADRFRSILSDRKYRIARIYPHQECNQAMTVSVTQADRCADLPYINGNGSYYSFRLRTNANERVLRIPADRADIQYSNGSFRVGSEYTQGLIAELPDPDAGRLAVLRKQLKDHKIASDRRRFTEQRKWFEAGVKIGDHTFSTSVPARVNSTYLLRSVAFRSFAPAQMLTKDERERIFRTADTGDLRQDTIVLFTVVGKEPDGSLIFIWRTLSEKDAPVLKR